jgi:hypothetical protein
MLLMSNLMGRQIGRNCLPVDEMFINGQMLLDCLGAESRALPLTLHNTYPQSYPQPVDSWQRGRAWRKTDPRVLSSAPSTYILPQKKFALK